MLQEIREETVQSARVNEEVARQAIRAQAEAIMDRKPLYAAQAAKAALATHAKYMQDDSIDRHTDATDLTKIEHKLNEDLALVDSLDPKF